MARWLLQLRDRIDHDVLPLTQQALSQILGVRRTTVNLLMRNLRARSDQVRSTRPDRDRPIAAGGGSVRMPRRRASRSRGDLLDEDGPISHGGTA
jgi:hypothetical protein